MPDDDELVLRPQEVKTQKPRRAKAPKKPKALEDYSPTYRAELAFKAAFEERFKFPMAGVMFKMARDRKLLKDTIAEEGEAGTIALIQLFFRCTDPQIKRCRFYNVPDFRYWAPRLKLLSSGNHTDMHERTASNVHEISKAMGRRS